MSLLRTRFVLNVILVFTISVADGFRISPNINETSSRESVQYRDFKYDVSGNSDERAGSHYIGSSKDGGVFINITVNQHQTQHQVSMTRDLLENDVLFSGTFTFSIRTEISTITYVRSGRGREESRGGRGGQLGGMFMGELG